MPYFVEGPKGKSTITCATKEGAVREAIRLAIPKSKQPALEIESDQLRAVWSSLKRSGWKLREAHALAAR